MGASVGNVGRNVARTSAVHSHTEGAAEGAEEAAEDPETHEGPDDRMDWEDRASEDS